MAIEVTPDEVGTVEIPSLTLQANNGRTYTTLPQTLTVYPYSAIKWNTLNLNGTAVPYGMLWHVDNQKPYVHQPDRCELKIYAPEYILEYTAPAITTENQWLTYIRHDTLGPISILSGAVMLTFLALLTVTRRHGALLTILATLSGLVTVAAVMNYIMYPETPESIPADRLLVVTQKTPGRHAADMNSPALITLPESTPLILRAERGSWYYASTFQNTPVWIPRTDAQPL